MAKVYVVADLPDGELEGFLQVLRGWDYKKRDRHLMIQTLDCKLTKEELLAIFARLSPMFDDVIAIPPSGTPRNQG